MTVRLADVTHLIVGLAALTGLVWTVLTLVNP